MAMRPPVPVPTLSRRAKLVLGAVAVAFFFLFFASFGMGVLGVPWLYPTEINALEMRTKGM